ncbi:DegT/DnrJ/EryC1/StrS family aminotransferase [Paenibacillus eucommiae]|uniref:dTDP-4-amino-4,6-dideoxygalactose transaminase n=1 Tax=Paenibacillus eucommiae TaxID=1355755 RepID=A0ABS4J278_9BACL|nr:DegT/DnrJ/EryC1/StrS family aminotransferase [Paenibacillus eucommiae]MBP1993415.1 dTDP-4-amino-4,6-dideoxygalactose transaminase [Paenibacillus eucommiae]
MTDIQKLALFGGKKAVTQESGNLFTWPIITQEDEEAALDVLRRGAMSGTDVTMAFEEDYSKWLDVKYALGFNTGTASLQGAMFGCGVGVGDEIICPSMTYWATCLQAFSLGATVVFADINPFTLCLDPNDIEHRITDRTKAIVVVHFLGYPADMDPILEIARKHNLKVIEDVSHAHGGVYKGRKLGTIGNVGAMSLMTGKALAIGEGGILVTDDRDIYERAVALGHYERYGSQTENEQLRPYQGLPLGGYKYRMHQVSSAVGRVQLRHYDERNVEIGRAMNYFWDLLEGVPGLIAHRTDKESGSLNGGWYAPHAHYVPEELEGLSVTRFCEAVRAEGLTSCMPGCYTPLHLHPLFTQADVYGHGKPTRIANTERDVRQYKGDLPVSEGLSARLCEVPWFKHYRPEVIEEYANAYRKVALNYKELLQDDRGNSSEHGNWKLFTQKQNS